MSDQTSCYSCELYLDIKGEVVMASPLLFCTVKCRLTDAV